MHAPSFLTGNVVNVRLMDCGVLVWDTPEDIHHCNDELAYKIRFYNGTDYKTTHPSQKTVMSTFEYPNRSWVKFTADELPSSRPLYAVVSA